MEKLKQLEREMMRLDLPEFAAGDTVKVHVKIKEGEKERIQVFQGVVISKKKGLANATFTVRKVSYGVGVERVFPMHSPIIDRVEVVTRGRVRRAKIYYLRKARGKVLKVISHLLEDLPETHADEIKWIDQDGPEVVKLVLEVTRRKDETKPEYLERLLGAGSRNAKLITST